MSLSSTLSMRKSVYTEGLYTDDLNSWHFPGVTMGSYLGWESRVYASRSRWKKMFGLGEPDCAIVLLSYLC
jgi:hypothetical protein